MSTDKVKKPLPQQKYFFKAGDKIHGWTIVRKMSDDKKTRSPNLVKRLRVRCECGTEMTIPQYYITRDKPKTHCGCRNKSIKTHFKQEYGIWFMMQQRCYNKTHVAYKDYGGRGISVCDEWRDKEFGFARFLEHVGPRPSKIHTIDRIDNDGNYQPGNLRWATPKEQAANRTRKSRDSGGTTASATSSPSSSSSSPSSSSDTAS